MADSDILRGAIQAAAGNTLGLTQDQVLDLKRQQLRERQRENRARRAERAGNQQEAQDFLAEDSRRFESTGSFEEQERYPDPFGIPRSAADPDSRFDEVSERGVTPAERQRGGYVVVDRGRGKERLWRERGQHSSEPKYAKNKAPDMADSFTKPLVAPAGVGMGGPNGLATVLADKVIRGEISESDLVPGSTSKTVGTLIQELAMEADPSLKRDADRAVGMQTAARDAERFSPARRAISDAVAEREAISYIANVDNGISDINRIDTLGLASKKFNKGVDMSQFNVVQAVDPNTFGDVYGIESWPEGTPLGYRDANTNQWVADVNFSTSSPGNQPVSPTATWISGNLPDFGQAGGTSFGARQVNPGDELALLNSRLGQFGLPTGIRGIDDLEQVVRAVTVDAAFRGKRMFNYDPEKGKAVSVKDPGLDEVLYGLNYTADEKVRLASALQNIEAAMRSPVNSLAKQLYAAGIPSQNQSRQFRSLTPVAGSVYNGVTGAESDYDYYETHYRSEPRVSTGFEKDLQLSRITNERVGRDNKKTGEKRISVRKGLRQLDGSPEQVFKDRDPSTIYATTPDGQQVLLPDAQQDLIDASIAQGDAQRPFQAGIEGQPIDRARFVGKGVYRMTPEQRAERFGPKGAEVANETIRRAIQDKQLRTAASKQQDPIAAGFRARDAQFEAAGRVRNQADNDREVNEAFERMGMSLEGRGQMLLGGQIVPDSRSLPAAPYRVASRISGFTENVPDRNVVPQGPLQATSAAVNPSTDPIPLAIRGGWMGGSRQGNVESTFDTQTLMASAAQKAAPMQEPLAGITYNETYPDPWSQPVGTGNGITQEIQKRSSSPQKALPYGVSTSGPTQGPTRPLTNELKNELSALSSGYSKQGPRPASNFSDPGIKPDGPSSNPRRVRQEADYRQSVRNLGRVRGYGRNAAIAGGGVAALAGINGLINGERNKREEEQYR